MQGKPFVKKMSIKPAKKIFIFGKIYYNLLKYNNFIILVQSMLI